MNENILQGKWKQIKGGVRTQWGKLTYYRLSGDEVEQVQGNYEQLLGLVQKKYGYARDKAKAEIDHFLQKHHPSA